MRSNDRASHGAQARRLRVSIPLRAVIAKPTQPPVLLSPQPIGLRVFGRFPALLAWARPQGYCHCAGMPWKTINYSSAAIMGFNQRFPRTTSIYSAALQKVRFIAQSPFRLSHSIKKHWHWVVAFMRTRLTNGAMEAINGLLQLAKRLARGFRSQRTSSSWRISRLASFRTTCRTSVR